MPEPRQNVVISISGHRDCVDPAIIADRLRQRLQEIKEGYWQSEKNSDASNQKPDIDTSEMQWVFLSPLALGADQLGAQVALDLGMELIVPLPMPKEYYKEDFSDMEWRNFLTIIERKDVKTIELPLLYGSDSISTRVQNGKYTDERNNQYAAVGAFLYHYSDIMLFLWDEKEEPAVGGTCFVKEYALKGEGINFHLPFHNTRLQFHPKKILWHLPVNRKRNLDQERQTYKWQELKGADNNGRIIHNWLRCSLLFQKELSYVTEGQISQSKMYLLGENASVPPYLEDTIKAYTRADSAAINSQKKNDRYRDSILMMTGLSLLCFCVMTGFPLDRLVFFKTAPALGYLTTLLAATLFLTIKRGWFGRGLDSQAIAHGIRITAEGLRVQFFLSASGLCDFVGHCYSGRAPQELGWILRLLRHNHLGLISAPVAIDWSLVKVRWIDGQRDYFDRTKKRYESSAKTYNNIANALIALSVLFTILLLYLWVGVGIKDDALLLFLIGLTPALAAYAKVWSVIHGYQRNAEEFSRMHLVFSNASNLWKDANDESKKEIVRELAKEALSENSEWIYYFKKEDVKLI